MIPTAPVPSGVVGAVPVADALGWGAPGARSLALRGLAQVGDDTLAPFTDVGVTSGLVGGAVSSFLTTLIVGAIVLVLFPAAAGRTMATVTDEPAESFVSGLVALVVLVLASIALIFTIVGILVVVFVWLAAILLWAVGAAIAYLAIADRIVGHEDGWLEPLLVASAISGVLALTGVGGLVALVVGAAGFGALLRDWRRNDGDDDPDTETIGAASRGRR